MLHGKGSAHEKLGTLQAPLRSPADLTRWHPVSTIRRDRELRSGKLWALDLALRGCLWRYCHRFRKGNEKIGFRWILMPFPDTLFHVMSDVTRMLQSIDSGNSKASEELLPLVYEELRRLAAAKLAKEKPGQTLQATALVHEAWIKLAGSEHQDWQGRAHFIGAAAEAMRRILVDKARRKATLKRGVEFSVKEIDDSNIAVQAPSEEIMAVHEALDKLVTVDAMAARIVKLRYFVGMNFSEIAECLQMTERSAYRYWAYARSWLIAVIRGDMPKP